MGAKADIKPTASKVGDIRPENIFIDENGSVKVWNLYSSPKEITNYGKSFEGKPTYLAPEEVRELALGKIENRLNGEAEVFSLGLTLLSAILKEDLSSLYNFKDNKFNEEKLNERVQ